MKLNFLLLLLFPLTIFSQRDSLEFCIAFYNTENLFHPEKDSLTQDGAFTPDGLNRWSYTRYFKKVNNIAKVIIALGKGSPPEIIGLAEIENSKVLHHLCHVSPLKKYGYQYLHYDSPDRRGIDVAILYRPDRVSILSDGVIKVIFPFAPHSGNRDILYCNFKLHNHDSIYLFVNHWTSRYGGLAATIPKRNYYASALRQKIDSLVQTNPGINIIIAGDFNDYPADESLYQILGAGYPTKQPNPNHLYNLMLGYSWLENQGSHKHEDFWGFLDQFIVSGNLLLEENPLKVIHSKAEIFNETFLLQPDEKYGGHKPFRTYLGPRYLGGFSDHLPIFITLRFQHFSPHLKFQPE